MNHCIRIDSSSTTSPTLFDNFLYVDSIWFTNETITFTSMHWILRSLVTILPTHILYYISHFFLILDIILIVLRSNYVTNLKSILWLSLIIIFMMISWWTFHLMLHDKTIILLLLSLILPPIGIISIGVSTIVSHCLTFIFAFSNTLKRFFSYSILRIHLFLFSNAF